MASTYKVIQGQNLYDVCVQLYGNISALGQLLANNSFIDSWSYSLTGGEVIVYDENLFNINPFQITASAAIPSTIATITGQGGQNIYDMLVLSYGTFDKLMQFLIDSGIDSVDDVNASGKIFTFDKSEIPNVQTYEKLAKIRAGLLGYTNVAASLYVPAAAPAPSSQAFQASAFTIGFL